MTPGPRPLTPIPTNSYTLPFRWPNYLIPSIPFLRHRPKLQFLEQPTSNCEASEAPLPSPSSLRDNSDGDEDDAASYSSYGSAITSPLAENDGDSDSDSDGYGDGDSDSDSDSDSHNESNSQAEESDSSSDDEHNDTPVSPKPTMEQSYLYGSTSVIKCRRCQSDLCFSENVVSKGFNGRHGRAYLCNPIAPHTHNLAKPTTRQLSTGTHLVADISCAVCLTTLGWKYISASDPQQHYKVGKFILETKRVVRVPHWQTHEVQPKPSHPVSSTGTMKKKVGVTSAATAAAPLSGLTSWDFDIDTGKRELQRAEELGDVNSEDEEELEDMFLGKWTPRLAAKRRMVWQMEIERRKELVKDTTSEVGGGGEG